MVEPGNRLGRVSPVLTDVGKLPTYRYMLYKISPPLEKFCTRDTASRVNVTGVGGCKRTFGACCSGRKGKRAAPRYMPAPAGAGWSYCLCAKNKGLKFAPCKRRLFPKRAW